MRRPFATRDISPTETRWPAGLAKRSLVSPRPVGVLFYRWSQLGGRIAAEAPLRGEHGVLDTGPLEQRPRPFDASLRVDVGRAVVSDRVADPRRLPVRVHVGRRAVRTDVQREVELVVARERALGIPHPARDGRLWGRRVRSVLERGYQVTDEPQPVKPRLDDRVRLAERERVLLAGRLPLGVEADERQRCVEEARDALAEAFEEAEFVGHGGDPGGCGMNRSAEGNS